MWRTKAAGSRASLPRCALLSSTAEPFGRGWNGQASPTPGSWGSPSGLLTVSLPLGFSYCVGFGAWQDSGRWEQGLKTGVWWTKFSQLIVYMAHIMISKNRSPHLKFGGLHLQTWMFCFLWKMGRASNIGLMFHGSWRSPVTGCRNPYQSLLSPSQSGL